MRQYFFQLYNGQPTDSRALTARSRVSPNTCWLGAAPPRGVAETVGVLFLLRKLCYCIVSYIFLQEGWHDKYCIGSGKS